MESIKVYSPRQIYVGTFLGGPVAGVYLVAKNYRVMQKSGAAKLALLLGSLIVFAIIASAFVIPESGSSSNMLIPILYSGLASYVAWTTQVSKEDEEVSEKYSFISNWSVAKVAVISLIAFFGAFFALLFLALSLGVELPA